MMCLQLLKFVPTIGFVKLIVCFEYRFGARIMCCNELRCVFCKFSYIGALGLAFCPVRVSQSSMRTVFCFVKPILWCFSVYHCRFDSFSYLFHVKQDHLQVKSYINIVFVLIVAFLQLLYIYILLL